MAVTLPGVLLLLDVWPLNRVWKAEGGRRSLKRPILEKVPFFALMLLFCAATCWIQHDYAAMTPWDKLGAGPRVANAISGYLAYPAQLFNPLNLAAIYPYPKNFDAGLVAMKATLLLAITAACLAQLARRPWLAVGWFWYLGTALPVIGLVQVGEQAMADRYTYLPLIGPVVALVWTAADLFSNRPRGNVILTVAAVVILSALAVLAERQLQFWRNTIALFEHNIAVTPGNSSAWYTLGLGYEHAGDTNQAVVCYRTAKMLEPRDFQYRRNLATLLAKSGLLAAAEEEYQSLATDEPNDCHDRLGLSGVLAAEGRTEDSLLQLNEAVRLDPDCVEALNNLAWALATSARAETRDAPRAVALARHACELTQFRETMFVGTLAAAQAEAGQFDAAVATAQRACAVAGELGETNLLQRNQELLERYRAHKTAREE
jgi:tetratricopeptide (TPR) repeat protein